MERINVHPVSAQGNMGCRSTVTMPLQSGQQSDLPVLHACGMLLICACHQSTTTLLHGSGRSSPFLCVAEHGGCCVLLMYPTGLDRWRASAAEAAEAAVWTGPQQLEAVALLLWHQSRPKTCQGPDVAAACQMQTGAAPE